MKNSAQLLALLLPLMTLLTGCEIIGGIFKTGMQFGILLVFIALGVIFYLFSKMRKR